MAIRKKRILIYLIIFTVIGFGIIINLPLYNTLFIKQGVTNKIVYTMPLEKDNSFSIRYIHSIHRTPVTENYYVDDNLDIVVDSVSFDTFGVGIPSDLEPGQTLTVKDGKFVIEHLNRRVPYFDQRIGQELAAHKLITKEKEFYLAEISSPGSWVRFQAEKDTLLKRFIRRVSHWVS